MFFVDANIVVYSAVPSEYREACLGVISAVARGEIEGATSPSVLEEVWYLELSGRAGNLRGLASRAYTVFTPLLPVTDEAFRLALTLQAPRLGSNDRLHVGTCLANGIDTILTADGGFDGIRGLRRLDPLDRRGLRRLLSSAT